MRGRAVPTIVWSREARKSTRSTAPSTAKRARGARGVVAIPGQRTPVAAGPLTTEFAEPGRCRRASRDHPPPGGGLHEGAEQTPRPGVGGHLLGMALEREHQAVIRL